MHRHAYHPNLVKYEATNRKRQVCPFCNTHKHKASPHGCVNYFICINYFLIIIHVQRQKMDMPFSIPTGVTDSNFNSNLSLALIRREFSNKNREKKKDEDRDGYGDKKYPRK